MPALTSSPFPDPTSHPQSLPCTTQASAPAFSITLDLSFCVSSVIFFTGYVISSALRNGGRMKPTWKTISAACQLPLRALAQPESDHSAASAPTADTDGDTATVDPPQTPNHACTCTTSHCLLYHLKDRLSLELCFPNASVS